MNNIGCEWFQDLESANAGSRRSRKKTHKDVVACGDQCRIDIEIEMAATSTSRSLKG